MGAKNDKNIYSALSYIHVPNVHVLEHLIRLGFKQGIVKLSEALDGD
jgi:hypothetical protein